MAKIMLEKVKEILGDDIKKTGEIYSLGAYIHWDPTWKNGDVTLDGEFNVEYLEALVWWIRYIQALQNHAANQALSDKLIGEDDETTGR